MLSSINICYVFTLVITWVFEYFSIIANILNVSTITIRSSKKWFVCSLLQVTQQTSFQKIRLNRSMLHRSFTNWFTMNFIYAILVLFVSVLVYVFYIHRKVRRLPPGPWQLPIVGYLPWIDAEKPHETLTNLARVYGPICGFRMGSVYTVLLSDPQLIKQTFSKDMSTGRAPLYLTHGIMKGYGKIIWQNHSGIILVNCMNRKIEKSNDVINTIS